MGQIGSNHFDCDTDAVAYFKSKYAPFLCTDIEIVQDEVAISNMKCDFCHRKHFKRFWSLTCTQNDKNLVVCRECGAWELFEESVSNSPNKPSPFIQSVGIDKVADLSEEGSAASDCVDKNLDNMSVKPDPNLVSRNYLDALVEKASKYWDAQTVRGWALIPDLVYKYKKFHNMSPKQIAALEKYVKACDSAVSKLPPVNPIF
jgi:hypothetical protein